MQTKKTVYVIINPKSGASSKWSIPEYGSELLDPEKFTVFYFVTGYPGHGYEIAKQAVEDKIDYVIAVGGDGTVNEVGRALVHSDTILGIIPMGSGNGLARDLHLSFDVKKAIATIAKENIKAIDYGKVNGKVFLCTCGVGFDAEVAGKAIGKKHRGLLMYLSNAVETYFVSDSKYYEIETPELTLKEKAFVVTCANASQYGFNAHIAPCADLEDGKMDLAILRPIGILDVPKTSLQLFSSTIDNNKKMAILKTQKAIIRRDEPGLMHIDGDAFEGPKELEVEIIPKGLKVLVP